MKRIVRVGTRASALAKIQTSLVVSLLEKFDPSVSFLWVEIKTTGDLALEKQIQAIGSKGVFVKELDDALLAHEIDLAVHSLKDLPSELTQGIDVAAITSCEDPRDALIANSGKSIHDLPAGATVGTSSLRRTALIREMRPDLRIKNLRGNLDTRVRKLKAGEYDAIVVAHAGLKRLGMETQATEILDPMKFIPAIGQGRLAITCRSGDSQTKQLLMCLDEPTGHLIAQTERHFMARLEGGCQVPMGCYGEIRGQELHMVAFVATASGKTMLRERMEGPLSEGRKVADALAQKIIDRGGDKILERLRKPLLGKSIVITRSVTQGREWLDGFKKEGTLPIHIPVIRFVKPETWGDIDQALAKLDTYDLAIFTSHNSVEFLWSRMKFKNVEWPSRVLIAAIGESTAKALRAIGLSVAFIPEAPSDSEQLWQKLNHEVSLPGKKIFFPRAQEGKETLPERLRKAGADVNLVTAYRTVSNEGSKEAIVQLKVQKKPDWIVFGSGSQVRAFLSLGNEVGIQSWMTGMTGMTGVHLAALGSTAVEALAECGMAAKVVATEPTLASLIAEMRQHHCEECNEE